MARAKRDKHDAFVVLKVKTAAIDKPRQISKWGGVHL